MRELVNNLGGFPKLLDFKIFFGQLFILSGELLVLDLFSIKMLDGESFDQSEFFLLIHRVSVIGKLAWQASCSLMGRDIYVPNHLIQLLKFLSTDYLKLRDLLIHSLKVHCLTSVLWS